jgi:hypothetical protein
MLPTEISYSVEHVEYIQVVMVSFFKMCRKKGYSLGGAELDSRLSPFFNTRWLREPFLM